MNDDELLENIVSRLVSLSPDRWKKEYSKFENNISIQTGSYKAKIGGAEVNLSRAIYSYQGFLSNLLFGSEDYELSVTGETYKAFRGKKYRQRIKNLYHSIEEKKGRITEEDATDTNKIILEDITKETSKKEIKEKPKDYDTN